MSTRNNASPRRISVSSVGRKGNTPDIQIAVFDTDRIYMPINQVLPGTKIIVHIKNADKLSKVSIIGKDAIGNLIVDTNSITPIFMIELEKNVYYGNITFEVSGIRIVNGEDVKFNKSHVIEVVEEITEILPTIEIFRNNEFEDPKSVFLAKDEINIRISPTGVDKSIYVKMNDPMAQTRYHGISGGDNHDFVTRIQNTRMYGRWTLNINGTLKNTEIPFDLDYPFYLVRKLKKNIEQEYKNKEVIRIMNEINDTCFNKIIRLAIDCVVDSIKIAETNKESERRVIESFEMTRSLIIGKQMIFNKKYEDAIEEFDRILVHTYHQKGISLVEIEEYNEAATYFERILEIDPEHISAQTELENLLGSRKYLITAKNQIELEEWEKALKNINLVIEEEDNTEALFLKAVCLKNLRAYDDAELILEGLDHKDATKELKDVKNRRYLEIQEIGRYLSNANDNYMNLKYPEAIAEYDKILEINQSHVDTLFMKGKLLRDIGKNDDAIYCFELIIHLDAEHTEAAKELAKIKGIHEYTDNAINAFKDGNFNEAIEYLDKLLALDAENVDALFLKIKCLRELGKYDDALHYIDRMRIVNPEYKGIDEEEQQIKDLNDNSIINDLYNDASTYYNNEEYERAISKLDELLEIVDEKRALLLKAKSLHNTRQYNQEKAVLDKLSSTSDEVQTDEIQNMIDLNTLLLDLINQLDENKAKEYYEEAIEIIDKLLEIDSNNNEYINEKAELLFKLSKYDDAIILLENHDKESEFLNKLYSLVRLMESGTQKYNNDQFKEALLDFDKFTKIDSNNESINHLIATINQIQELLQSAVKNMNEEQYEIAIIDADEILKLKDDCKEAILLKIKLNKLLERYDIAQKLVDELTELDAEYNGLDQEKAEILRLNNEKNIEKLYRKAKSKQRDKSFDDALSVVEEVLTLHQEHKNGLKLKIQLLKELKRYSEAEEIADKLIEIYPTDKTAKKLLLEIQSLGEEHIKIERIERGDNLVEEEKYEDAILLYEKVLDKDPDDVDTLVKAGKANRKISRFTRAIEYFKRALSINPDYKDLNRELTETEEEERIQIINNHEIKSEKLIAEGKHRKAISEYDRILEIDPDNTEIMYRKAKLLLETDKMEEALIVLKELYSIDSKYKDVRELVDHTKNVLIDQYISTGNEFIEKDKYNQALKQFDNALRIDSKHSGALLQKARVYIKKDKPRFAHKSFDTLLRVDKNHRTGLFEKAMLLMSEDKYEDAIKLFKRAVSAHPDFHNAKDQLGRAELAAAKRCTNNGNMYFRRKEYQKAIKAYDCTLKYEPDNKFVWNNKGLALKNLNKIEEGIKCYRKAIDIDLNFKNAWNNLGIAFVDKNKSLTALEYYKKALVIDPEYKQAWNYMGLAYHDLKRYKEAIDCFKKACEIDPEYKNPWANQGNSLGEIDKHKEAIICYDKALAIDDKYLNAISGKGHILIEMKKYLEAREYTERALEIDTSYTAAKQGQARILVELGEYQKAINIFDELLNDNSEYTNGWLYKGIALMNLDQDKEALRCLEKARELEPKNKIVKSTLKKIENKKS